MIDIKDSGNRTTFDTGAVRDIQEDKGRCDLMPLESDNVIKYRNPDFPLNYIKYIKENIGEVDVILVSSHQAVRNAMNEAGIDFGIVFPMHSLKAEWIGRCFLRGSGEVFCKLIADKWDAWICEMELEALEHSNCYRLRHGEYLSDAMKYMS